MQVVLIMFRDRGCCSPSLVSNINIRKSARLSCAVLLLLLLVAPTDPIRSR